MKLPTPSYSALSLHRECPQAWNYRYLQHLMTSDHAGRIDRELGSWWHALRAMDSVKRGLELDSLRHAPVKINCGDLGPSLRSDVVDGKLRYVLPTRDRKTVTPSGQVIIALARAWWKTLDASTREAWGEKLGGVGLSDRLAALDQRWRARWAEETDDEAPLAVELGWTAELIPGKPKMRGYIDEVYRDLKRNLIVARDHKTHRTLRATMSEDDLSDSQLHLYGWGSRQAVSELTGETVNAVSYDRVRVGPPKTPAVTKAGNLAKTPSDYDAQTYAEWASGGVEFPGTKKDGSGAGVYWVEDKVIESLSTPAALSAWHQRSLVPLNLHVVEAHVAAARHTMTDTERTLGLVEGTGDAPRNLSRFGCARCDFVKLCRAEMTGGQVDRTSDLDRFGLSVK